MSLSDWFRPRDDGRGADFNAPAQPVRIEPMDVTQEAARGQGKGALIGVVGTTAAALIIGLVAPWEGKRNDPYKDIVGVWTVCYGETKVDMRRYSDAECMAMLDESLAGYAAPVLARNPELRGHPYQLAAAVSLAYNIGPGAYDRSSIARNFTAGQWRAACDAFMRYNRAGDRPVQGLTNRRAAERALCLKGL